jgi:hypothetical protein
VASIQATIRSVMPIEEASIPDRPWVTDSYRALLASLSARGVTVIPITIPYSTVYTDALIARNPDWMAEWKAAVGRLQAVTGGGVEEIDRFGPWWGDGSSTNIKHLSASGARAFTDQLWATGSFSARLLAALSDTAVAASPDSPH